VDFVAVLDQVITLLRQRLLDALKRVLLRESQVQPLLLVFEDLHWIDTETQVLLDRLVNSLPTACLLLLVNYRPEYQHGWSSKTYYTQLRLDPLPPARIDRLPPEAKRLLQTAAVIGMVVPCRCCRPIATAASAPYTP
jgi:predicted ATPase